MGDRYRGLPVDRRMGQSVKLSMMVVGAVSFSLKPGHSLLKLMGGHMGGVQIGAECVRCVKAERLKVFFM